MQQSLSEQIYQSLKEVRDVVSERYERGLTSSLDLRLSESALANSELQKINQSIQSVRLLRDLEVLLGKYPSSSLVISKTLPLSIPSVPAGIPSELIERRPDVKAAINRMEAASYEHVQSKRNLFPSFSLTATGGTSASDLNNILNGDYSVWNLGANITAPIFQSGRLRNNVKLKNSQLSISEIEAAKTMIRAFSEVEQALFVQNAIKEQLKAVSAAEQQSKAAYLLAFDRYQKGLTDLVTVLNSQNQWRNTQSLQISVQKNQIMSFTNVLLALGGNF
jgi:outer membrane protein TolC